MRGKILKCLIVLFLLAFGTAIVAQDGTGIVSGSVFVDHNGNGIKDGTDSNYAGATVTVNGNGYSATSVSGEWNYWIGGVPVAGKDSPYTVSIDIPQGMTATTATAASITIRRAGQERTVNFGLQYNDLGTINFPGCGGDFSPRTYSENWTAPDISKANGVWNLGPGWDEVSSNNNQNVRRQCFCPTQPGSQRVETEYVMAHKDSLLDALAQKLGMTFTWFNGEAVYYKNYIGGQVCYDTPPVDEDGESPVPTATSTPVPSIRIPYSGCPEYGVATSDAWEKGEHEVYVNYETAADTLEITSKLVTWQIKGDAYAGSFSPNLCLMVVRVVDENGQENLWITDLGGANVRQLTKFTNGEDLGDPYWANDWYIYFVADNTMHIVNQYNYPATHLEAPVAEHFVVAGGKMLYSQGADQPIGVIDTRTGIQKAYPVPVRGIPQAWCTSGDCFIYISGSEARIHFLSGTDRPYEEFATEIAPNPSFEERFLETEFVYAYVEQLNSSTRIVNAGVLGDDAIAILQGHLVSVQNQAQEVSAVSRTQVVAQPRAEEQAIIAAFLAETLTQENGGVVTFNALGVDPSAQSRSAVVIDLGEQPTPQNNIEWKDWESAGINPAGW